MKKLLLFLMVVIFTSALYPVNDTVTIKLYLLKGSTLLPISTSKVIEGQDYIFPQTTLPQDFAPYQYYYDAIAGGKFYLEPDAISENITIYALMNVPQVVPWTFGNKQIWFFGDLYVEGYEETGFQFENNKNAVFEFPRTPIFDTMVKKLGYNPGSTWHFAYWDNSKNTYTTIGVNTDNFPNKVVAKLRHFSQIGAGDDKLNPTAIVDTVTFRTYLQKGVSLLKVADTKFLEGQEYILPQSTLQGEFAPYQYYYDALAGGKFYIETGGLDSNITVDAIIDVPPTVPWTMNGKTIWFMGVIEALGWGPDNFYFKDDKAAVFEFPRTAKFDTMVSRLGFAPGTTWKFAYLQNSVFTTLDLSTINDTINNKVIAKLRHFSQIGAGDDKLAPTNVDNGNDQIPTKYYLGQNFPNPFNPSTTIEYYLPKSGFVTLKLFNILGTEISTLLSETKPAGKYKLDFNPSNLASGVYLYQLRVDDIILTKKMILVK